MSDEDLEHDELEGADEDEGEELAAAALSPSTEPKLP